ncbi:hypothetical protein T484DRAFT_1918764 [Baffinella frigidus]|nr:hypothetical protein T484DRAFT_1918764 [Cryptophyta sp. CCMP2293]
MAPSSYTSAAIIDGIDKKEFFCEIRHHKTRRLSLPAYLTASVDDKTFAMEQYAPSSPRASYNYVWAPATEMDEDSVERPEDICQLSNGEWDLEAVWSADECAAAEGTAPANDIHLEDAAHAGKNVWHEAGYFERTESDDLRKLLEGTAAPPSDVADDAAGFWVPCQDFASCVKG